MMLSANVSSDAEQLKFDPTKAAVLNVGEIEECIFIETRDGPVANTDTPTNVQGIVRDLQPLYLVTVAPNLQENFDLGLKNGVWGVPKGFESRLNDVKKGDHLLFYGKKVGFVLCRAESDPFFDNKPLWNDNEYPRRVQISQPMLRSTTAQFRDVGTCLRDKEGFPYKSVNASAMAIKGAGGMFRRLADREVACIASSLSWEKL